MKLKVCGIKEQSQFDALVNMETEMIGLNFYAPSKRYITEELIIPHQRQSAIVGVFVNSSTEDVLSMKEKYKLDYAQLHGDETLDYCIQLHEHIDIIKVWRIGDQLDVEYIKHFEAYSKFFLFDTHTSEYGGSGRKFDWDLLQTYTSSIPVILSGGISADDAVDLIKLPYSQSLWGVDINSKFELSPGIKDIEQIKSFRQKLNT